MKIKAGEMAKILGLSANGLKLYEQHGIISPTRRDDNGYRLYGVNELQTMGYATQLRRFGFSMQETAALLNHPDQSVQTQAMAQRAEEIEAEIEALIRMRKSLREHVSYDQQAERLMDHCEIANAPAMYFLGLRRGEKWIEKQALDQASQWMDAYSPHTFSAALLDGPYCLDASFDGKPQYGLAVPGAIALELGLLPSAQVTYMLPKPCVQTAFRMVYDQPDYSDVLTRVRAYAEQQRMDLQGGCLVLVTNCWREQPDKGSVTCNCLLWAPVREEEHQYGLLR